MGVRPEREGRAGRGNLYPARGEQSAASLCAPFPLDVGLALDFQDKSGKSLPFVLPSGTGQPVTIPVLIA